MYQSSSVTRVQEQRLVLHSRFRLISVQLMIFHRFGLVCGQLTITFRLFLGVPCRCIVPNDFPLFIASSSTLKELESNVNESVCCRLRLKGLAPSWWLVLTVAFLVRSLGCYWWQEKIIDEANVFRFGDSYSYWTMAENLWHHGTFQYGSEDSRMFRVPLYPFLLAPFTSFTGHTGIVLARIFGMVIGTYTVLLAMLAARRIADEKAALSAGWLVALFPGAIGMSFFILSEVIFVPLCLISLMAWKRGTDELASNEGKSGFSTSMLMSGIFSGLACLTRPSWILWPAMLVLDLFLLRRKAPSLTYLRSFQTWCIFLAGMTLTLSPWWIRNFSITGRFVPTTLQVGATLYDSFHEGATGGSDENMQWVDPFAIEQRAEDAKKPNPESTFEYRLDKRMKNAAIQWVRENPSDVARLALLKFARTWSPLPSAEQLAHPIIRYGEAIAFAGTLALVVVALMRSQSREAVRLYVLPCVYVAGLHLVFVGSIRYRQPAMIIACVAAGVGFSQLVSWIHQRARTTRMRSKHASVVDMSDEDC